MSKGYVCSAIAGIDGLPVMMQEVPLVDGTAVPNVYIPQTGTIGLSILVGRPKSDNQNDYYNLLDSIGRAFYHRRNENPAPGTLIIQRPDGSARKIAVYTTSGLNTPDVGLNDMTVYSLSLSTPDPYWTDLDTTVLNFTSNVDPGFFTQPILPFAFNSPNIFGTSNIVNQGTVPAYPTWLITGPGTPTITNNTSKRAWSLNTAVPAGQQVQVVTQRGQQSAVNVNTGANVWSQLALSSPRDLWPLVGGNNSVTISIADQTNSTEVAIFYANRWIRA
jgi:hypothetical protein